MNLTIRNVGPIASADMKISRINVIGGVNSSGKSIASKLLYCHCRSFLKGLPFEELVESEGIDCIGCENVQFSESADEISEVFYIDTISAFDLAYSGLLEADHIRHLIKSLECDSLSQNIEVISKIDEIIGQECADISSAGIKQFGIIRALLLNGSLKKNSFLIMDEPESSLHPDWQVKFAQILVLLSKELDIGIYLNSHSPMFIEAVSLYSEYYGMLDETSFYLTTKSDNHYVFKRISPRDMAEVYENLTAPYDVLDSLKAKIMFRG